MTLTHTHSDLCALAVGWLRRPDCNNGPACTIAVSECTGNFSGEIPDAIGWRSQGLEQHCVLVEVKVTRQDFLSDRRKPHRSGEALGMGQFRYYMAPAGLIALDEVPTGWGLIEVSPRKGLKVRSGHVLERRRPELDFRRDFSAWSHKHDMARETALLVRLLSRVGDVEVMQQRLKSAYNTAAQHARRVDELQVKLDRMHARHSAYINACEPSPSQTNPVD